MSRIVVAALAALTWMALAGCVTKDYGTRDLRAGMDEAAVLKEMGPPTDRYKLPDGVTRLVYARGPAGKETYMVDVGPDGRVTAWRQVLSEAAFERVRIGMTAQEMLLEFGPPSEKRPNRPTGGQIWSYRYPTYDCKWFQVEFNGIERVVVWSYQPDPKCASWS